MNPGQSGDGGGQSAAVLEEECRETQEGRVVLNSGGGEKDGGKKTDGKQFKIHTYLFFSRTRE